MEQMTYWHWWILAVVLIVAEIFAPGAFLLWLGVSAGVVGLLLLLIPTFGWEYQLLVFAVLAVSSILLWRGYLRRHPTTSDQPNLNRRGAQYVGRTFTLTEPVVNGYGKIHVDDSTWKIEGADCPAGTRIKVTGVDGVILKFQQED